MATELERNELNGEADVIRFDALPDDVLLDIFDFYINSSPYDKEEADEWQTLVHVCRRWRGLVFGSPRRLNLRLRCTPGTCIGGTMDTLGTWPPLPLIVKSEMVITWEIGNIIGALWHSNRICEIVLHNLADWQVKDVLKTMLVPFPELTVLELASRDLNAIIPGSFLGKSAPNLRRFVLESIPFPGLPNLLLSATHLAGLWLTNVPPSGPGYISPEMIVTCLSALSSLKTLHLKFKSYRSHPDFETRHLPSPRRSILPALEEFSYKGIPEYLENLVNRIDTPQLDHLRIEFWFQSNFDYPRLAQFIDRTPKHRKCDKARLRFGDWNADVLYGILQLSIGNISYRNTGQQLSSFTQVCSFLMPSSAEELYIERRNPHVFWKNNAIEDTLWSQLFVPFTSVKNLYLYKEFSPGIVSALQVLVADRTTEVLPSLQSIFVEELEPSEKYIEQFVVARRLSGHSVAMSDWVKDSDMESI